MGAHPSCPHCLIHLVNLIRLYRCHCEWHGLVWYPRGNELRVERCLDIVFNQTSAETWNQPRRQKTQYSKQPKKKQQSELKNQKQKVEDTVTTEDTASAQHIMVGREPASRHSHGVGGVETKKKRIITIKKASTNWSHGVEGYTTKHDHVKMNCGQKPRQSQRHSDQRSLVSFAKSLYFEKRWRKNNNKMQDASRNEKQ